MTMENRPADGNAIPLFRSEAIRFQAARLEGEVMLKIRSPWLLLGSVSACLVLVIVITACFTTYTTRARVAGMVVSTAASAAIASDSEGVVSEVYVRDGDEVAAGAPLMRLRSIERAGPPGVRASTAGSCVPETRVAVRARQRAPLRFIARRMRASRHRGFRW